MNETLSAGPIESPHAIDLLAFKQLSRRGVKWQRPTLTNFHSQVQICYFHILVGGGGVEGKWQRPTLTNFHSKSANSKFGGGGGGVKCKTRGLWQNFDKVLLLPESGEGITDSLRVETNNINTI